MVDEAVELRRSGRGFCKGREGRGEVAYLC